MLHGDRGGEVAALSSLLCRLLVTVWKVSVGDRHVGGRLSIRFLTLLRSNSVDVDFYRPMSIFD